MGLVALDTSVLIAFFEPRDGHHQRALRVAERLNRSTVVVSVLVYAEVMVGALRDGRAATDRAERFFDEAIDVIEPVTRRLAREGAALRAAHRALLLADAMVIATGDAVEADETLTFDARWAGVSPRVRVLA